MCAAVVVVEYSILSCENIFVGDRFTLITKGMLTCCCLSFVLGLNTNSMFQLLFGKTEY